MADAMELLLLQTGWRCHQRAHYTPSNPVSMVATSLIAEPANSYGSVGSAIILMQLSSESGWFPISLPSLLEASLFHVQPDKTM
jgi:hypothetical protein